MVLRERLSHGRNGRDPAVDQEVCPDDVRRIVRREVNCQLRDFQRIGHPLAGGLDIRQLIWDLHLPEYHHAVVDGGLRVTAQQLSDHTTAVQSLDQIEDLLLRLGSRRLEIGEFRDMDGQLRLIVLFPTWEDFLRLAFDEIRYYGAQSVQVMRRMKALVNDLGSRLPEDRRPALRHWEERLQDTIARSFEDEEEKQGASVEDRQGLGVPRRESAKV